MSWFEVECKLKVSDEKLIREKLRKISTFIRKENKIDDYYSLEYFDYPTKSLRVRNKGRVREVNFKQRKNYLDGIHAKKEVQFHVSDLKGFFDLIEDFGFRKWMHKEKHTELYRTKSGVNIELNRVKDLGWFLELEVLCDEKDIVKARKKIEVVRKKLGFSSKDSIRTGYTKMFWNKK